MNWWRIRSGQKYTNQRQTSGVTAMPSAASRVSVSFARCAFGELKNQLPLTSYLHTSHINSNLRLCLTEDKQVLECQRAPHILWGIGCKQYTLTVSRKPGSGGILNFILRFPRPLLRGFVYIILIVPSQLSYYLILFNLFKHKRVLPLLTQWQTCHPAKRSSAPSPQQRANRTQQAAYRTLHSSTK